MRRPPRRPDSPLVSRSLLRWSGIQGGLALVFLLGLAAWANQVLPDAAAARTIAFAGLVAAVLVLVFANRSFKSAPGKPRAGFNLPLLVIMAFVVGIFSLVFLSPAVAGLFHFAVLGRSGIVAVAIVTVVLVVLLAAVKTRFRGSLTR